MSLLVPGAVLAGYRIESVVGRGGMGVVYRAVELDLDRVVALKVIAPELIEDEDVRQRFLREARAAASIEHPNVIPVHAAGERDGLAFLAMRLIEGDDARTLVRRGGPLSAARAADLVAQAGAGLDAIHRAGYVHRDVKPANVLVSGDGHVYVTDFGLAKQVLTRPSTRTGSGHWVGTLDYIAPEQIRGGVIDARADVYALGGVLCFLVTAQVPFDRDGDEAKLWAQLTEPPPVPSRVRPGLPRELDGVVARAMAKAAADRYPSAGDLGRAAQAAAQGVAPSAPERMVARGAAAPAGAGVETAITAESPTVTARHGLPATTVLASRRRLQWVLVPLGLLVLAGVAFALRPDAEAPASRAGLRPTATATPPIHVQQTIRGIGHRPNAVAIAGGTVWITSHDRDEVERIDAATGHKLPPVRHIGRGATDLVADRRAVWVSVEDTRKIVRIDPRTGRVTRRLSPGGAPAKLALGFGSLWAGIRLGADTELLRYNLHGRELSRRRLPRGLTALATSSRAVWIIEQWHPRLVRIDPRTLALHRWRMLPGFASVLVDGGDHIWATLTTSDLLARIETDQRNVRNKAAGHLPAGVALADGKVFVASNTEDRVLVLDPDTLEYAAAPVPVRHNPYAIAADRHSLWVTGVGDNTVTRIAYN